MTPNTATTSAAPPAAVPVFFFDIDNCVYPFSANIDAYMLQRIVAFGVRNRVAADMAAVESLCWQYYKDYGLAIKGLLKYHPEIDPVVYDREVDGGLPLEAILQRDETLRSMLATCRARLWAFTNAGKPHAERVLALLGIREFFEGITYCHYEVPDFASKPEPRAYREAMRDAGVLSSSYGCGDISDNTLPSPGAEACESTVQCYLVDDSEINLAAAEAFGWITVHVTNQPGASRAGKFKVGAVQDLPKVLPELWDPVL